MSIRSITFSLLLAAIAPAFAATVSFPDFHQAKQQAKTDNEPLLILWYGSDWMQDCASVVQAWEKFANDGKLPIVFGQYNDKTGQTSDERRKNQNEIGIEQYDLPAAVLLAPDGTLMATWNGKDVRKPEGLAKDVAALIPKAQQFMKLAATARDRGGVEGAQAAGAALKLIPYADARRHKELTGIINSKDPDNKTGMRALFAMDHQAMYKEINNILNGGPDGKLKDGARNFDDAARYVQATMRNSGIEKGNKALTETRQQWLAGLAYVYREKFKATKDEKDRKLLLKALADCVKLNPKSQYGIGAAKYHHYWDPKSFTVIDNMFYNPGDQTHNFEKDWHVLVSKSMDGSGTYEFELVPRENGRLITRNFRLVVNGREVAKADAAPDKDTKKVTFKVPAVKKSDKVEVWLTAECRDGWFGCSGEIKMTKIR